MSFPIQMPRKLHEVPKQTLRVYQIEMQRGRRLRRW